MTTIASEKFNTDHDSIHAPTVWLPKPLDRNRALALLQQADLFQLGLMAETVKHDIHGENAPVTFVIDRNVNYTNVCNVDCLFCAFYRHKEADDAYTLEYFQIKEKTQELVDADGTQLLLQGGVNPELPFEYYLDIIRRLRADFPTLTIHAFSPTEIDFMATLTEKPLSWVLQQLIDAGISSIPGGGAEVLHDDVRLKVSHKKVKTASWLDVMEEAHHLGLQTTATMMFGMVEKDWHIVDHLFQIRELQARTGGFTAFIPWTFQRANTKLEKLPVTATAVDYLKVSALARLVLDNVPNIQASWITQGLKIGQTALCMGANDIGGLLLEENVVTQAGISPTRKTVEEIVKVAHNLGRDAAQRDTAYRILKPYPRDMA
ncbi:MAG: dehypoxanthine futalosine cyclase [Cyanobacteria bacterium]|nr:dehypoxanthine futalosine cyclase [Cyanobacteriota bacterium]